MSAETSVPRPRESDVDISDSGLFKGLLSEAEFAFAFFDADGKFQRVNDVFTDIVGVPAERLVGRPPVETLAADLNQLITHAVQAVIESDGPITEGRVRVRSTEGDTRHWSLSFSPVHDTDGELRAIALVGLDVTESRQTEEDLRRSEERYRSLVEAQSQLVWITSPTGTVVEDAPQWRAITGQGLEEYLAHG